MFVVFYDSNWDCDIEHITVVCLTDSIEIARKVFSEMKLEDYMSYKAISEVNKDVILLNGVDCGKIIAKEYNEVFTIVHTVNGVELTMYSTNNLDDALAFFDSVHDSIDRVSQKKIVGSIRGVLKTSSFLVY